MDRSETKQNRLRKKSGDIMWGKQARWVQEYSTRKTCGT